ncbi:MAG: hypothetical protein PHV83_03305 [Bacteroidales bacterium]|jgi:predicted histone-like DNA-binding protein|nr:hypothetical protein [Bacteroidales bacterium]MDD3724539.1 hypothetical protein [Bacteroidales bacterium]MDD4544757.1 hypothetical protein [Bacteroidales bacterium]
MGINYYKQKRKVAINGEIKEKYVAKLKLSEPLDEEGLADIVTNMSTMSRADIIGVLTSLETAIIWAWEIGHPVHLQALGNFRPSIEAEAKDTAEEVTARTIKKFKIIYNPSKYLKKKFPRVEFIYSGEIKTPNYKKEKP